MISLGRTTAYTSIRKFGLLNSINIIAENTEDAANRVRFIVLAGTDIGKIKDYINKIIPDCEISLIESNLKNPVLSKVIVNREERYDLIKGIIGK